MSKVKYIRVPKTAFLVDGLLSAHNDGFNKEQRFVEAYKRAVNAAGWDYNIPWRTHVFLWAGIYAHDHSNADDVFIELGTGRGWMMSALMHRLASFNVQREVFLFDSFESTDIDKHTGKNNPIGKANPHYAISFNRVEQNFKQWPSVNLVKGWLPDSLKSIEGKSIAFLHVDLNHPAAEVASIEQLYPQCISGCVIILDDYAYNGHEPQYEAINELKEGIGLNILSLPTGQGLIIKP